MTILEKIKDWVAGYPGFSSVGELQVDALGPAPPRGGVFPQGTVESQRQTDILGNSVVWEHNRFVLRFLLDQSAEGGTAGNAELFLGFQGWVQEQCALGLSPRFGNVDTDQEVVEAKNGRLQETSVEGTATYTVELSIQYKTYYEVM